MLKHLDKIGLLEIGYNIDRDIINRISANPLLYGIDDEYVKTIAESYDYMKKLTPHYEKKFPYSVDIFGRYLFLNHSYNIGVYLYGLPEGECFFADVNGKGCYCLDENNGLKSIDLTLLITNSDGRETQIPYSLNPEHTHLNDKWGHLYFFNINHNDDCSLERFYFKNEEDRETFINYLIFTKQDIDFDDFTNMKNLKLPYFNLDISHT